MKKNIGSIDKIIRIVVGLIIAIWGFMDSNWFGLIAIIPIATAFINFCPLYTIFGLNTCKIKSKNE